MSWRGEEESPRVRYESTFGCAPPTYYNSQQAPLACQARREMLTYLSSAGNFEWQWGTGDQWVADTPRFFRGDHGLLGRTTVASGAGSHEGECFGGVGGARRPQEAILSLPRRPSEAGGSWGTRASTGVGGFQGEGRTPGAPGRLPTGPTRGAGSQLEAQLQTKLLDPAQGGLTSRASHPPGRQPLRWTVGPSKPATPVAPLL